jgi:hypothetical protein
LLDHREFKDIAKTMLSGHDLPDGIEEYIDNAYIFLHRAGNFQFAFHDVAMFLSLMGLKPADFKPVVLPPKKIFVAPPVDWSKVETGAKVITNTGKEAEFVFAEDEEVAVIKVGSRADRIKLETIALQD